MRMLVPSIIGVLIIGVSPTVLVFGLVGGGVVSSMEESGGQSVGDVSNDEGTPSDGGSVQEQQEDEERVVDLEH